MSQVVLNYSEIDVIFQEMGCVGVPEGMYRGLLLNASFFYSLFENCLQAASGHGFGSFGHVVSTSSRGWE